MRILRGTCTFVQHAAYYIITVSILTPAGEEHLDGDILQQVATREDGADLAEVPFAVQVLAVL